MDSTECQERLVDKAQTEQSMDEAAEHALQARRRIERAVEAGQLPPWVLDACERWEKAALSYGAGMARREEKKPAAIMTPASTLLH